MNSAMNCFPISPAYSPPDLALCDYFLSYFQTGRNDSEERDSPPESSSSPKQRLILKGWNKSYYSDGLKKLENHWIKCIELKRDYIEK